VAFDRCLTDPEREQVEAGLAFPSPGHTRSASQRSSGVPPSTNPTAVRQAYDLRLTLKDNPKETPFYVNVMPATANDLPSLATFDIEREAKHGDIPGLPPSLRFRFPGRSEQVYSAANPKWQYWTATGVRYLVLFADLPGVFHGSKPGAQDPRRQIIPLDENYWPPGTKEIEVEILASRIHVVTPPRPGQSLPAGW
jgi:hypothetical protein